ncbi:MAG: DUF3638 domain-containing protein, partial [Parachlamydiaceae bacterium]|nr:DUF3638 domain-containing protein [Parachlamydiaceae bacterium]
MNNIDNFNKIASILKTQHCESLDRKIMHDYTPRLWGETFVNRSSFEGRIICFIRGSMSIDNSQKKWKHIFRNMFIPETNSLINSFSEKEKNEIFKLKYTYLKKNKNLKDNFKKSFSPSNPQKNANIGENSIPLHWSKDAAQLKLISLLATWSSKHTSSDTQIVEALFGLNNHEDIYNPIFLEKFTSHVNRALSNQLSNDLLVCPLVCNLINHAIWTEQKFQTVIESGHSQSFSDANLELKKLSSKTADSIKKLKLQDKTLIFGGILARAPKINLFESSHDSVYQNLQNLLNEEPNNNKIVKFLEEILQQIQPSFENREPIIPKEVATKISKILEDGFLSFIFPNLNKSLINSEQNFSQKILLAIPELVRHGTNATLSFAEKKIIEGTTEKFSKTISKELCLEIVKKASEGNLKQLLKDKIGPSVKEHLSEMRTILISSLNSLGEILPTAATELISALNYGELGSPESPLWLEVSCQQNGKYSLSVYATGHAAAFQGAVPLMYQDLTINQLDTDFFMRFFTYRAWPKWDAKIQYSLKDIHQELFASLNTKPSSTEGQLQNLSNEIQKTSGAWGLCKALICSHHTFKSTKDREYFFYNWKKNALIDTWMQLQSSPNFKNNLNQHKSLQTASENLAEEAVTLFDQGVIDINEYKSIFATTWEINETFNGANLAKPSRKKTSVIPPEIVDKLQGFFGHIPAKNSFLARKLIIDILGTKVEPVLDEIFEDFHAASPIPTASSPISQKLAPPTKETRFETFKRLGRKFTNIFLDATIGINLNDLSAPTAYTYLKTAFTVARITYSIFFTPHALAVNLQWAIVTIAGKALVALVETCFPAQVSFVRGKLNHVYKQLEEWRLRLIAYATARLLLNDKQRKDFTDLITSWQSLLSNEGKLSFELPEPSLPPLKTHSFKKFTPEISVPADDINIYPHKFISVEPPPNITTENCLQFINYSLAQAAELVPDKKELFDYFGKAQQNISSNSEKKIFNTVAAATYCNDQIKALPVPLPDNQQDCWSQVNDPHLHLEQMCSLTLKLYSYTQNAKINNELQNQIIISLYKAYAIIDKLARRCPEADLEGYKVNPWALALLKKNAFFRIVDSEVQKQFAQVCAYFGIDFRKDYSDAEIADLSYNSLFYENDSNSFYSESSDNAAYSLKTLQEKIGLNSRTAQALSPAERRYYTGLLLKPEIQQKLEELGIAQNASFASKLGMLYADGNCSPDGNKASSLKILPRSFSLLRLTNFLANNFVESIEFDSATQKTLRNQTSIKDIDSFSPATYIEEDSSLRTNLSYWTSGKLFEWTTGRLFEKQSTYLPFRYLPGCHTTVKKLKIGNATKRDKLAPVENTDIFSLNLLNNRSKHFIHRLYDAKSPDSDQNTFCQIITNYLHQRNREQNEIINNTSGFNNQRQTEETWLFSKPNDLKGTNMLENLSKNERAAIEMIWSDEADQAVRTLAFFSQRIEELYTTEFFMLFEILLLRSDVLEQQLKTDPMFAKILGNFFKIALAHYAAEKYRDRALNFIEIGIYALSKARTFNPCADKYFPNFPEALLKISISVNESAISGKMLRLMHAFYSFVDPSMVSLEDKKRACHHFCQITARARSHHKGVSSSLAMGNFKWILTIAKTLNENPEIRNEVLNALAKELNILPNGKEVSWNGEYPHFSSGLMSLGIDLQNGLSYTQEREDLKDQIITELKKVYGNSQFEVYFRNGQYHVKTEKPFIGNTDDLLIITIEQTVIDGKHQLQFRKIHKNIIYRWVEFSTQPPYTATDNSKTKSLWLEEKQTGKIRQLLTLHNGVFENIQSVEKQAKGAYTFLTPEAVLDKTNGVKVDLTRNAYGLGLLAWFQPLSAIQAFRSILPPYNLNRIEFSNLDLIFTMENIGSEKRGMCSRQIPGFYIAEEQRPAEKKPVLNNFASYLLLENQQKQNKIILSSDNLKTALASWLLKKAGNVSSSRFLDKSLAPLVDTFLPTKEKTHSYFVYGIDEAGRLTSEDPTAFLHLLLYCLAQEELTDACHYLTLFEGCGKRMKYAAEISALIQSIEIAAMLFNDPSLGRIALRLCAIKEENRLIQNVSQKGNEGSSEKFITWLSLQVNMHRYLDKRNTLPHLPIDEYQELFILYAMARKGKEFALDFKNNQSAEFATLFETIGADYLAENFLMLPEMASRYTHLKNKYSMDGDIKPSFSTIVSEIVKENLINIQNLTHSPKTTDGSITTEIQSGLKEHAIQKLINLLPINSKKLLKSVFQKYSLSLTLKYLFTDFRETNAKTFSNFVSDYGLAFNKKTTTDQIGCDNFADQAKEFKNKLRKDCNSKRLHDTIYAESEFLLLVSNSKLRRFFPDPEIIKSILEQYQSNLEELERIRGKTDLNNISLSGINGDLQAFEQKKSHLQRQFEQLMHSGRYNALAEELSSKWEELPIHFSELSFDKLSSHFFTYYQLAIGIPPIKYCVGTDKHDKFLSKASAFKKSLRLVHGKDAGEKQLLEILQRASSPNFISVFPNPHDFEVNIQELIANLENNVPTEQNNPVGDKVHSEKNSFISSLQKACLTEKALTSFKDYVFSYAKNQAQSLLVTNGISCASALAGLAIPAPIKFALKFGPLAYKGYQAYDAITKKYNLIEKKRALASAERQALVEKNNQAEVPLTSVYLKQLSSDDAKFALPCQHLLNKHFKKPSADLIPIEPILPFDCPSDNPIVKKAFERLNESLVDFYARPQAEKLSEELNSLENFYQLNCELEHLRNQLQSILEKNKRKLLLIGKRKPTLETRPDDVVITSRIKESSFKKAQTNFSLEIDATFSRLVKAFVDDSNTELMRLASIDNSQLPQLKLKLYRYLLRATRLQHIERALAIQKKINPNIFDDPENKIRIRQLSFELGRKRAYPFSDALPSRLMRGYLAFEYGSGMMLWDRQVNQLQNMLLGNHSRALLELIMGSGKTVFGTPMISFFGSNGKQVIANFFPEALASENIKDLSKRSHNFFGQTANAFKISRGQPLTEENLWGLQSLLMRAMDLKENLNACKKDFQALQLIFIEEANRAIQHPKEKNEALLWGYMKLLGFIRKNVRANIDEAHLLLRYNEELNHPTGSKKKVKQSYVNVISECMRLLVAIPEIKEKIAIEENDQTLFSTEEYHTTIKPLLAKKLVHFRPFAILPEQRKLFIEYLCGNLTETPD